MSKERQIFQLVEKLSELEEIPKIGIHDSSSGEPFETSFRIYHADGYCWDVEKEEYVCEPEDVEECIGVDEDGCVYRFTESWDGFTETGIDKALEILKSVEV